MTRTTPRLAAIALSVAAVFAVAPLAQAAPGTVQLAQSSEGSEAQFSDAKLEAFAMAALQVSKLVQQYGPKIKQAQDAGNQQEAQKMANEVRSKAETAIKQTDGISVQEYTQINRAAQQDKQLQQRVTELMKAEQSQSSN